MHAAAERSANAAALLAVGTRRRPADGAIRLFWDEDGTLPDVATDAYDVLLTPAPARRPWVRARSLDAVLGSVYRAVRATPMAARLLVETSRAAEGRPFAAATELESRTYSHLLGGDEFRAWRRRTPIVPPRQRVAEPVRYTRSGDDVTLTLADPARLNAYSTAMRDALAHALDNCRDDPTLATLTLRGDGRAFCSGGALDEFGTARDPWAAHRIRMRQSAALRLAAMGARATAVVHGPTIGSGLEIAAAAGRVIARPDAWFRLPEIAMGLITGAGGIASIGQRVGRHRLNWLLLSGSRLDAPTALDWGLVDAIAGADGEAMA